MPRNNGIIIRLTPEERAEVGKRAAAMGLSLSAYMRRRALEDGAAEVAALKARIDALAPQLARFDEMRELYENLERLLADPRWKPVS